MLIFGIIIHKKYLNIYFLFACATFVVWPSEARNMIKTLQKTYFFFGFYFGSVRRLVFCGVLTD